jgi:Tfp pilus assembly protein PilX
MNRAGRLQFAAGERGAALATALIILSMLSVISMTVLAVVTNESRIAGSDLQRTQTFYASACGVEKMTSDFCSLFARTSRPTTTQLNNIAAAYPSELTGEGFTFSQTLAVDTLTQSAMSSNTVTIPTGPFSGLIAAITPYMLTSTATQTASSTQVSLQRRINNYLIPIFQFGMFSNEDIELHPGPAFSFNGRVHANGNIYVNGNVTFLSKVTTANEFIDDVLRNDSTRTGATVSMTVGGVNVPITMGSMDNGPNISGAGAGQRGYFPGSPNGTINSPWDTLSVAAVTSGTANQFGGQLLTRTTGGVKLLLPLETQGFPAREIVKRSMPNDTQVLTDSRFHSKAEIRILLDDETPSTTDAAGIPSGKGVTLSTFDPIPLPNTAVGSGGGRAMWQISDAGAYTDTGTTCLLQATAAPSPSPAATTQALTARGVKSATQSVTLNGTATKIPGGAGITGRILIQIVDANGNTYDVTSQILSMGMTEGEPNAIVMLQRPLWTAFTQGGRDASGGNNYLTYLLNSVTTYLGADGEILVDSSHPTLDPTYGYLTNIADDAGGQSVRVMTPPSNSMATLMSGTPGPNWTSWNAIVPINVYNVREGHISTALTQNAVYERGITNVVEINMRNLARWMDGVYDGNLLAGTNAVSTNIGKPDGYTVYVSDRRGDRVKSMVDLSGATINASNGMVDNEDIYGWNGTLDPGEDVQNTGVLVKDTNELPDPTSAWNSSPSFGSNRTQRAIAVAAWSNPNNYFRRSVRVFNGENLQVAGAPTQNLSTTLGITISSENMVYIWGNYNTTGINAAPPNGTSALNDSTQTYYYTGNQVPASFVCDAIFPLSKTFFDASTAMNPDQVTLRPADNALPGVTSETSVRAGVIAGNNLSALSGTPDAGNGADSRLSGGMHNFPRFLEDWLSSNRRWNYVGSFIPLYHSTQALGPWWYVSPYSIYYAPIRDWAFDVTFTNPNKLPPGTPLFQYIEPSGFKEVL